MGSDHSTYNHGQRSYSISTAVRSRFQVWSPTKTDNGKWVKPNFRSNEIDGKTTENETLHNKCGTSTNGRFSRKTKQDHQDCSGRIRRSGHNHMGRQATICHVAYNTTVQSSTKKSPFEVLFGKKPVIPTMADITWPRKTTAGKTWTQYVEAHLLIVRAQALDSERLHK